MKLKNNSQPATRNPQPAGAENSQLATRNSQPAGAENPQPATRRGGELGFTLVEVLVALTILVIGLLGVALMQVVSIQGNTFSREMAVATGLGQDMLEKLKTLQWTELTVDDALTAGNHPVTADINRDLDGDGEPPYLAVAAGTANIIDERGFGAADAGRGPLLYTRTWTVTDDQPATNMKTIEVTVLWKEKGTTDRSVTISGVKVCSAPPGTNCP